MQERNRTPWQITRLLMVLCWLVWIFTFFIAVTLFQAAMQVRVVANVAQAVDRGFISFSKDFMEFVPMETANEKLNRQLDEMMLRYYLEMRYSVIPDEQEMERRWGERGVVAYLSTPAVYKNFHEPEVYMSKIDSVRPRVVDITSIKRKGNSYQVDLDLYEYDGIKRWGKQSKSLNIGYAYVPARAYMGTSLPNPNGFIVTFLDDRKATN